MRTTKALLCAAALAAGAVTSMAQSSNVYSLNVVGYINLTLTNGYNLIANQLDVDGNATNNTLQSVFGTNLFNGSQVYAYVPSLGTYKFATWVASTKTWSGATNECNAALAPGHGAFLKVPVTAPYPQVVTLVGNVLQGTNVMPISAGYQFVSSVAPISGGVQTVLGYKPTTGDQTYTWDVNKATYSFKTFTSGTTWSPGGELVPAVGQAFFLKAKVATNWTQGFSVQ